MLWVDCPRWHSWWSEMILLLGVLLVFLLLTHKFRLWSLLGILLVDQKSSVTIIYFWFKLHHLRFHLLGIVDLSLCDFHLCVLFHLVLYDIPLVYETVWSFASVLHFRTVLLCFGCDLGALVLETECRVLLVRNQLLWVIRDISSWITHLGFSILHLLWAHLASNIWITTV